MSKIAFIYPGQGSQTFKMGEELYNKFPIYKECVDAAITIEPELEKVLFKEESEKINDTYYAQLAIFSSQYGIMKILEEEYDMTFEGVAGFSLGEYSAFQAANLFDYQTGLEIIKARGQNMKKNNGHGAMVAVVGLTYNDLEKALEELEVKDVTIANYNLEKQIVIAGDEKELAAIEEQLKEKGAKRYIKLAVSGAFHTEGYRQVATDFSEQVKDFAYNKPQKEIYTNLTGGILEAKNMPEHFIDHMVNGVKWYDQIQKMIADGYDTFVEVGTTSVVSAMVKKIDRGVKIYTVKDEESINNMEELWKRK